MFPPTQLHETTANRKSIYVPYEARVPAGLLGPNSGNLGPFKEFFDTHAIFQNCMSRPLLLLMLLVNTILFSE